MALTRKFLSAMGIESDKIEEIMSAHVDVVNGLKDDIATLTEKTAKLDSVQKELNAMKETAEAGKGDQSKLEVKYNALKEEFENYKSDISKKETVATKQAQFKELLQSAGVQDKRIESVLRVTNLDAYELEGGKFKDSEKIVESIKTEWADFIPAQSTVGAKVPTPPSKINTSAFATMSLSDKMKYANENPNNADVREWLKR